MIEFFFFGKPIKTLGSLGKIRVGRVTGNTHIFFFGLTNNACVRNSPNGTIGNFSNGTIGSQWYHW